MTIIGMQGTNKTSSIIPSCKIECVVEGSYDANLDF